MRDSSGYIKGKQPFSGLFPLLVEPTFWGSLRGAAPVTVFRDHLAIGHNGKSDKILLTDIAGLNCESGNLILHLTCGKRIGVSGIGSPELFADLLNRLKEEESQFKSFMNCLEAYDISQCWEKILEFLEFRAEPYVMSVDAIVKTAERFGFSDIHLEPFDRNSSRISYRIATSVFQGPSIPREHATRIISRLKHLAGCLSHLKDEPQEGAFDLDVISVRLSTFPADRGERISLRFIAAARFPDIDSLGWDAPACEKWRKILNEEKGLVLICGPVGSGKTTAMYASLSELACTNECLRVVTIEDPVEACIPGVCQSSLDNMKEKKLADAFKHLLRQDPDVIGLGEIRDSDCIREALQASLSGHLVVATFHAGSANEAIERIKQMGVDNYMILSGLKSVISLNLVKKDNHLEPVVEFFSSVKNS